MPYLAALVAGCGAFERAEVELAGGPATVARTRDGTSPARRGPSGARVTLTSADRAERASLGLVVAALDLASALGKPRSALDGIEHFARADGPHLVIRLERAGGRGRETWLIDNTWALRRLDRPVDHNTAQRTGRSGAVLVWEGRLAPAMETLSLVLPGSQR